jgi:hypothetical protein
MLRYVLGNCENKNNRERVGEKQQRNTEQHPEAQFHLGRIEGPGEQTKNM